MTGSSVAFAQPNVGSIAGVIINKLPPGEALGARDLTTWSLRRASGWSGTPPTREQFIELKRRKQQRKEAAKRRMETAT
jgi:hypothetical protein